MLKTLELFGGIGAPRRALENIGIPIKAIDYVEIDAKAVRSYNSMFEHDYKPQNVCGWNLKPDILIHGSPCQDFSIAGHQKGADEGSNTRSSLMWETINIIKNMGEWKPKAVIWENVPNVLSKHMIKNFSRYMLEMSKLGYTNSYDILNAIDFGLPQKRRRVFTVSLLGAQEFNFTALQHKRMQAIQQFLEQTNAPQYEVTQPSMLKRINATSGAFQGRVPVITTTCQTITTKQMRCPNAGVLKTRKGYRYLTERECWKLQGFSDQDYEQALKANPSKPAKMNSALYKQAGNSMAVPCLEAIFQQLLNPTPSNVTLF